jgi:glucokinase
MRLAGIEIGGTKLQIVVGDETGKISDRYSHIIEARQGASVIRRLVEQDLRTFGKVDAIGVGFGGPVNRISGEIWTSYHVDGWTGFNLLTWLRELTGAFVTIDNDANVAALGEATVGAGRQHNIVLYVTVGSGIGSGLTIYGEIYHGQLGGEMEFGHVRLDRSGRTVQDACSGWAVNAKVMDATVMSEPLAMFSKQYPGAEAKALLPAIDAGDAAAMEIINATASDLAFGLSHAVHLLHPDTVIIGGGLSLIGEMWRSKIEQHLRLFLMDAFQPGPVIQLSRLGEDVVPVGALILAGRELKNRKG